MRKDDDDESLNRLMHVYASMFFVVVVCLFGFFLHTLFVAFADKGKTGE